MSIMRTYVFSVEVFNDKDGNPLKEKDSRIHIYENNNIEKALTDLQNEIGWGYKILDMYSEPLDSTSVTE